MRKKKLNFSLLLLSLARRSSISLSLSLPLSLCFLSPPAVEERSALPVFPSPARRHETSLPSAVETSFHPLLLRGSSSREIHLRSKKFSIDFLLSANRSFAFNGRARPAAPRGRSPLALLQGVTSHGASTRDPLIPSQSSRTSERETRKNRTKNGEKKMLSKISKKKKLARSPPRGDLGVSLFFSFFFFSFPPPPPAPQR